MPFVVLQIYVHVAVPDETSEYVQLPFSDSHVQGGVAILNCLVRFALA